MYYHHYFVIQLRLIVKEVFGEVFLLMGLGGVVLERLMMQEVQMELDLVTLQ